MANELSVEMAAVWNVEGESRGLIESPVDHVLEGEQYSDLIQTVSHSAAAAPNFGGLTAPSFVFLKNLDVTNHVTLDRVVGETGYPVLTLRPGQWAMFPVSPGLDADDFTLQADTAAVNVRIVAFQDDWYEEPE